MDFMNTWGGIYFGWRDGDDLFAKDGRHVGQFRGKDVVSPDGLYLGEIREHRLLTSAVRKGARQGPGFLPNRLNMLGPTVTPGDEPALDLPAGFEDFPSPDQI